MTRHVMPRYTHRKRWHLFPPEDTASLYPARIPYEESSVFSQVDVLHPDLARFPAFARARPHVVTLQPGQVTATHPHNMHIEGQVVVEVRFLHFAEALVPRSVPLSGNTKANAWRYLPGQRQSFAFIERFHPGGSSHSCEVYWRQRSHKGKSAAVFLVMIYSCLCWVKLFSQIRKTFSYITVVSASTHGEPPHVRPRRRPDNRTVLLFNWFIVLFYFFSTKEMSPRPLRAVLCCFQHQQWRLLHSTKFQIFFLHSGRKWRRKRRTFSSIYNLLLKCLWLNLMLCWILCMFDQ